MKSIGEYIRHIPDFSILYRTGGLGAVRLGIAHVFDHWKLQFSVRQYYIANHKASETNPDTLVQVEKAQRQVRLNHAHLEASARRLNRKVRHVHPKAPGM